MNREIEVKDIITEHLHKTGTLPTSRGVMSQLGLRDDRSIRAAWDRLAARGEVPERPGPTTSEIRQAPDGSGPGRTLTQVEEKLRNFIEKARAASDREVLACSGFWEEHLGIIGNLIDEAMVATERMSVDDLISTLERK